MSALDRIPLARTLAGYRRSWLGADLVGGISVCVVMVPSVVAYAGLADLPPVTGLYAALLAMVGYAIFASSRHVITGPDAALTLLVGASIAPLAAGDPQRAAVLAAALAVLTGLILLFTALIRAGVFADLLSKPVLTGYLTGAALILISTQLEKFFGMSLESNDFFPIIAELWDRRDHFHTLTVGLGAAFVLLQIVLRFAAPRIPGALAVFVTAIILSFLIDLPAHGVALVGHVPAGLPRPAVPLIALADLQLLLPGALGAALLVMPEGILLARAFAARHGYEIRPNQEIAALGVANVLAGFFQGFSVGASQSRTTVNDAAGGKTPIAGFVAAAGLILVLLFFMPILAKLPNVALAAILIVAGAGLIEIREYRALWRFDWRPVVLALLVVLGVLLLGVIQGIILGVVISLIYVIGRLARPKDVILSEIPGTARYHDRSDVEPAVGETVPGLIAYRFYAPLMFANAEWFVTRVRELVDRSPTKVRCFVLDAQAIWELDITAVDAFRRLATELSKRKIAFKIARANRPLREIFERSGIDTLIGEKNFHPSVHSAVREFLMPATDATAGK